MLGLLHEARQAAASRRPGFYADVVDVPEGWSEVGSGGFRTVILAPSGYVYKVERDGRYGNKSELEAWAGIAQFVPNAVPRHYGWEIDGVIVIAAEYVPHTVTDKEEARQFADRLWQEHKLIVSDSGASHPTNLGKRDDGSIVILDAGCGACVENPDGTETEYGNYYE